MADVFLSFVSEDRAIGLEIAAALSASGYAVLTDDVIGARSDWLASAADALRGLKAVVSVWSPSAARSRLHRAEAEMALRTHALVPVLAPGFAQTALPSPFDSLAAIEWSAPGSADLLVEALAARGALPSRGAELKVAPSAAPQRRARASRLPEEAGAADAADIPDFLRPSAPPPPGRPSAPAEPPVAPAPLETLAAPAEGKVGPVDVFVCYSRHDADACRALVEELGLQNLKPFYDQFLEAGDEWRAVIAASIRKAPVIVVLLSARSTASAEVRREINFALDLQKPVIPVVIDAAPLPDAFKLALAKDNYVRAAGDLPLAIRKASNRAKEIVAVRAFDERHLRETFGFAEAPRPSPAPTPTSTPLDTAAKAPATGGARGPAIVLALALSAVGCAALYRLAETRGVLSGVEPRLAIALLAAFVGAPYALATTLLIRAALRR